MSASAHTPGKWKAEDRGHRVHGIRFFWLVPDKVSMGTANPADAQLAAAAPELLAALEALLADCGEVMSDGYVENSIHGDEVAAARAAIAKATGAA